MMGKTHSAAGMLAVAAFAPPISNTLGFDFTPGQLAVGVAIGAISGVLPDIDHPKSMITHGIIPGFKRLGPIAKALGWILSIPPRLIGIPARATMNHRGGTHSITFLLGWTFLAAPFYSICAALAALLLSFVYAPLAGIIPILPPFDLNAFIDWLIKITPEIMPLVSISVFLGYLSHLVTDSMTNVPVPWPWPFSKKRILFLPKGLRITTDSFAENVLIRPLIWLALLVAIFFNIALPIGQEVFDKGKEAVTQEERKDKEANKKKKQKQQKKKKQQAKEKQQNQNKKKQKQNQNNTQ